MKKWISLALVLLGSFAAKGQALNEVKFNILNTILIQSVELGYEHFIDTDQSIGVDININDRFSYYFESKKTDSFRKFETSSLAVNYNFYFGSDSMEHASGIYVSPFLKYRFGKLIHSTGVMDMNSLIIGVGGGYKLVKNDAFTITPFVNIARNFSEKVSDRFMPIELNAGINIGYRF